MSTSTQTSNKREYEEQETLGNRSYSACKTVVSSNSTFLLRMPCLVVTLGRFREAALAGGGVGPILKTGVHFPTGTIRHLIKLK